MEADLSAQRSIVAAPLERSVDLAAGLTKQVRMIQFMLLTIIAAASTLAARAISPLQEAMRAALLLTDNHMALLQGPALALPVVIAAIPLGFLIDRKIRIRLLFVFGLLDLMGCLLTAAASGFELLFLARCLVGLSTAAITITSFSLLADLYPPAMRGRAKAVVVIGQHGGTALAFALGGWLLVSFDTPQSWRWTLLWLTVPAFILVLILMLVMREPPRTGAAVREPSSRQTFRELRQYRSIVLPLMIGIVLVELSMFAVLAWAAPTLARSFDQGPDRAGVIIGTAMMVSGILGPVLGGTLADFCHSSGGPRRTITVLGGLALLGVPGVLFPIAPSVTVAAALLVMFVTIVNATMAMGITMFTIVIPNELRGLCLAILSAAISLFGVALGPVAVSLVSGALGGPAMVGQALAWVCITANVLCALSFVVGRRSFPRPARVISGVVS